jgi:acetolactate synthase I/II/III large subunit
MGPKLLAEKGNIPMTTTLQGLGAYDETEDKSLYMLGMHGSAYANIAMQQADVIITLQVGAQFDDCVTGKVDMFAPRCSCRSTARTWGIIHFGRTLTRSLTHRYLS